MSEYSRRCFYFFQDLACTPQSPAPAPFLPTNKKKKGNNKMSNFAAPNMTAVGTIGGTGSWDVGRLPLSFSQGSEFSIESWFMPGVNSSNVTIFSKPGEFSIGISNGVLTASWPSTSIVGTTPLTGGMWHYLAVCFDGANLKLYLDGVLEATLSCPSAGRPFTPSSFIIGADGTSNDPCDLWSVALYRFARSAKEEEDAPWVDLLSAFGLVAYFDFSFAPPQEKVQNHPIAAQNGAVSQTVAPAVAFDGSQSRILIGQALAPGIPAEFTISAWVYSYYGKYPQIIFSSGDPASDPNTVQLAYNITEGSNISILCIAGQQTVEYPIFLEGAPPDPRDWHNIAVNCDSDSVMTLYFDGQAIGFQQLTATASTSSKSWTAGCGILNNVLMGWFYGYMQRLTVWGRSLSDYEIAAQQYSEFTNDPTVLTEITLDAVPPNDLASQFSIELAGTAISSIQRNTLTTWFPPGRQPNNSKRLIALETEPRLIAHQAVHSKTAQLFGRSCEPIQPCHNDGIAFRM